MSTNKKQPPSDNTTLKEIRDILKEQLLLLKKVYGLFEEEFKTIEQSKQREIKRRTK